MAVDSPTLPIAASRSGNFACLLKASPTTPRKLVDGEIPRWQIAPRPELREINAHCNISKVLLSIALADSERKASRSLRTANVNETLRWKVSPNRELASRQFGYFLGGNVKNLNILLNICQSRKGESRVSKPCG